MTYGQTAVSTWLFSLTYLIATVRNGPRIERRIAHFLAIAHVFGRVLGLIVLLAAFRTIPRYLFGFGVVMRTVAKRHQIRAVSDPILYANDVKLTKATAAIPNGLSIFHTLQANETNVRVSVEHIEQVLFGIAQVLTFYATK